MLVNFCKTYGLGSLLSEPQQVLGGLLHTMYRVETESGVYAVKVLNPEIMQRPAALQNMIRSEQVLGTIAELKRQTVQMAQLKSWLEEL